MSLYVYTKREEVPKDIRIIDDNVGFFNGLTNLEDCEFTKVVLAVVDKAEYVNQQYFCGRVKGMGSLNKSCLSAGTKTILNVKSYPERYCFNLCECGANVLALLPQLREGHVLWDIPAMIYDGEEDCDIVFKGKRYVDVYEFMEAAYEL